MAARAKSVGGCPELALEGPARLSETVVAVLDVVAGVSQSATG